MSQARPRAGVKAAAEGAKLWGGRFSGSVDPLMEKFNESLSMDKRMAKEDIQGSKAYARALAKAGIITKDEAETLVKGLRQVAAEWADGTFEEKPGDEDIHTANERRLSEIVGSVGGKLHTGRSRNDQVATDTRLYMKKRMRILQQALQALIAVACERAESEVDVLMPGFTHLQSAQTVRWSHWVMCHCAAWQRDHKRASEIIPRIATLPLGSGALAGNPFLVDRQFLAEELEMEGGVCPNSMDAVSDRDFAVESIFWCAMVTTHLSRFAEDLIIYSSAPFGFVQCSDAYATGSSLMPQKKNPDALELMRGKAGVMQGNLAGAMSVLKSTPTTYNKDFQEVWALMYDSIDTTFDVLRIATGVLATLTIKPDKMLAVLTPDMLATDLAEYLVRKGVPFRETHHISGACVKLAEDTDRTLFDLTMSELKEIDERFEEDVMDVMDFTKSAESRDTEGGASKRSVLEQVEKMRSFLAANDAGYLDETLW
ncbi:unnamed protein product [Pedinophyceae sp. YPF-701]|nr:unnamed protein product [Pedinophyceae sp. YPF-701]